MNKKSTSIVSIGLTILSMPVAAQEFYLGGSLGSGTFTSVGFSAADDANIQSFDIFAGVRFDIGSGFFLGVEVQKSFGQGYPTTEPYLQSTNTILQGEIHVGLDLGSILFYGFVGTGQSDFARTADIDSASTVMVQGIGVEMPIAANAKLRLEVELSKLSIDDNCCGLYDPVTQQDVSLGVVFNF